MSSADLALPDDYRQTFERLKQQVSQAQTQARRTINTELIQLYWTIGKEILVRQEHQGWGSKIIARLAEDLRAEFPQMRGFSPRNLQYMTTFARHWNVDEIAPQPVAQLPWGHIRTLLDKPLTQEARQWYAAAAVEFGWSRNVLLNMIKNNTIERTGAAPSNFPQRLPAPESELAQQVAKDPYAFEFLGLSGEVAERDVEQALTDRIVETLRELGPGFAFVGRQVHVEVGGDDYYIDLLFFHVEQLRYFVVELKTGKFQPEYAGKLNFYVAVVDDQLKRDAHAQTVGILICGSKNDHSVRYALSRSESPMAVATYTYESLPSDEKKALPAEHELSAAFKQIETTDDSET